MDHCSQVSTDPMKGYTGVDLTSGAGATEGVGCFPVSQIASGTNGYVAFTQFHNMTDTKNAIYCGDGTQTRNGTGLAPPGIQASSTNKSGGSGRVYSFYCEGADDIVNSDNTTNAVRIYLSWTSATDPVVGHIETQYAVPKGATTFPLSPTLWTQLRTYWFSHT